MNRRTDHSKPRPVLAAICAAVGITYTISVLFYYYGRADFGEWISTLLATFIGALLAAAVGIWLFNYQSNRNGERRSQQLLASLAAELHATLDVLESKPRTRVQPPEGSEEEAVEVILASLEPTACEEAIRSAVLTPQDVFGLTRLARVMRSYTEEANLLVSIISGPRTDSGAARRTFDTAKGVKQFQTSLIYWSRTITEGLENRE